MANTVKVTVVSKNGLSFIDCPYIVHLPCPSGTIIDGQTYYYNSDENQTGWSLWPETVAAASPAASFAVIHATVGFDDYYIVFDEESPPIGADQLADLCNTCCGTTEPELPAGTIPTLAPASNGIATQDCATGDCTYTYNDLLPASGNFTISFNCNGAVSISSSQNLAGILAYVQGTAPFSTFGTWTLVGRMLTVTGTACQNGALTHTVVA
jgi:hypothetical protein